MTESLIISYPDQDGFSAYCLAQSRAGALRLCDWNGKTTCYDMTPISLEEIKPHDLDKAPVRHLATATEYAELVDEVITALQAGGADKVVLSRVHRVHRCVQDVQAALERLRSTLPTACVFHLHTSAHGSWLCASPELLLRKRGALYSTMALAGTRSWQESELISWSEKELQEQAVVANYITALCDKEHWLYETSALYTRRAGSVAHLCTDISIKSEADMESILSALHPTPAICGLPLIDARRIIDQVEKHDRELYCGYMHIENPYRSEAYVILRCARLYRDAVDVHVGGGINTMSVPEDEWHETVLKSRSIMSAIEV